MQKHYKHRKIISKTKKKVDLEFFETKWFKLLCLFIFCGWLIYPIEPFQINKNELQEIKVTVKEESKSGGKRSPVRLSFKTKEYSNKFGIYVGGVFGRWTEVKNVLQTNNVITIRFHKKNKPKLNSPTEIIPIYYLKNDNAGLLFDEDDFNEGEKSSKNRILIFLSFVFVYAFWRIVKD